MPSSRGEQEELFKLLVPPQLRPSVADEKISQKKCVATLLGGIPSAEDVQGAVNKMPCGASVPGRDWQARLLRVFAQGP